MSTRPLHIQDEFYLRIDGVFYVRKNRPHTRDSLSPAKRSIWIVSKAKDALLERPSVTPSEMRDLVKKKHKITIDLATLSVPLRRVRLHARGGTLSFGHIASVFEILSSTNEGTSTSLVCEDEAFKRVFLALSVCVRSLSHTTRVLGVDWCHVKAGYGGVLLVTTALDGNSEIFPAALAIAESENAETLAWFLSL